jgi:hypothetical protein
VIPILANVKFLWVPTGTVLVILTYIYWSTRPIGSYNILDLIVTIGLAAWFVLPWLVVDLLPSDEQRPYDWDKDDSCL